MGWILKAEIIILYSIELLSELAAVAMTVSSAIEDTLSVKFEI